MAYPSKLNCKRCSERDEHDAASAFEKSDDQEAPGQCDTEVRGRLQRDAVPGSTSRFTEAGA